MVENLKIVDRTISSSDSDIASGSFTVPESTSNVYGGVGYTSSLLVQASSGIVYYNYHTAVALEEGSTTNQSNTYSNSICPKGWQLPKGNANTSKSWYYLYSTTYKISNAASSVTKARAFPFDIDAAGMIGNGTNPNYVGTLSTYPTNTSSGIRVVSLYISNSNANNYVVPNQSGAQTVTNATPVRCVAK